MSYPVTNSTKVKIKNLKKKIKGLREALTPLETELSVLKRSENPIVKLILDGSFPIYTSLQFTANGKAYYKLTDYTDGLAKSQRLFVSYMAGGAPVLSSDLFDLPITSFDSTDMCLLSKDKFEKEVMGHLSTYKAYVEELEKNLPT